YEPRRGPKICSSLMLISGLMLPDLEPQELLDGSNGLLIAAGDYHASAILHLLIPVLDPVFQLNHRRHSGRRLIVDEHGDTEVTRLESPRNVFQVIANLVDTGFVVGGIGCHLDGSAVFA